MRTKVGRALAIVGIVGCAVVGISAAADNTFRLGQSVEVMVNLMRTINLFYVDEVPSDKLMNAAGEGMTKILDPYTTYLGPDKMEEFEVMTKGKYGGVGSLIRYNGERVEFSRPYRNSPADRAGIRPGDVLLEIDGKDATGLSSSDVSNLLKGDPGSQVSLTIGKFPTGESQRLKITRERIAIPGVPYYGMVAEGVGYIAHSDFTEGCSSDLLKAYNALKEQGMESLILDYRGNGGGILEEAVKILSYFLPAGSEVVTSRDSRKGSNRTESFKTEGEPIAPDMPVVVMVDRSSASAAEIVAGALQDYDRAVLIGQRTYGKGLLQSTMPLGYGAYAKVTTAKYYLPSGRCIQAIDYAAHNEDGSVATIPDSLVSEFTTRNGRKVYDGGGVMPDVAIDPEYVSTFAVMVYAQGLVDDFLRSYCATHYDELEGAVVPTEYSFTPEAYEEFVTFMADKEVAWESYASRLWAEFKKAVAKERWEENMEKEMALIERNITNDTKDNLRLYQKELSDIIENEMVSRYCYTEGSIRHSLSSDTELKQAIELLANQEQYKTILSEVDTARN